MERVNEVTKDCFNALIQLRSIGEGTYVAPEMLYQRFTGFLEDFRQRAYQAGMPERDLHDIMYAIAALADEVAMRSSGGVRDVWMQNPLQLQYFNENLAGENFFHRLEYILADPSRQEALRVYHYCLAFGFQGRYAMRGGELELAAIQRRVQDALGSAMRPEPLSQHHLRPRERVSRRSQFYVTVWIGLFAVLFSLALIIVLRTALDAQTNSVIRRIDGLLETSQG